MWPNYLFENKSNGCVENMSVCVWKSESVLNDFLFSNFPHFSHLFPCEEAHKPFIQVVKGRMHLKGGRAYFGHFQFRFYCFTFMFFLGGKYVNFWFALVLY